LFPILLLVFAYSLHGEDKLLEEGISEKEAIQIAEEFVKVQGYTNVPASAPKEEIIFEFMDIGKAEDILQYRRGTLNPQAVGARQEGSNWLVGFRYAKLKPERDTGRAVRMNRNGENPRIVHEDIFLSFFK